MSSSAEQVDSPSVVETLGHGHEREPLGAYATLMATFVASAVWAFSRSPLLRAPIAATDIAILGLACARIAGLARPRSSRSLTSYGAEL